MKNIVLLSAAHIHSKGYVSRITQRDDCRLLAVWDDVEDRGKRYAESGGGQFVSELDAALNLDEADGFIICDHNTRHTRLLEKVLPVGKPVFCEKPLTVSAAEAASTLSLVKEHGTPLVLGYFKPFTAPMRGVQEFIRAGSLGRITHARYRNAHTAAYGRWFDDADLTWFTDPALAGGGAFMDMGTHAIHLLRTLFGTVDKVLATIHNRCGHYPDVDDHGIALCQFASCLIGTAEASWVQNGGAVGLEVCGSEGTICDQDGFVVTAAGSDPRPVPPSDSRPTQVDRLLAAIDGTLDVGEIEQDLACAADAVAIMEACYRSNSSGKWEDVSPTTT